MTRLTFTAALLPLIASAALAQASIQLRDNRDQQLSCRNIHSDTLCDMREQTVASTGRMDLDGFHNGSVTVRGWNRNDIQVRLRLEAHASSDGRAKDLMSRIHPTVTNGRINIDGPQLESLFSGWFDNEWWSVSAEVFVPHRTALRLATHNGAVRISDLDGEVNASAHNGEIVVDRVLSHVRIATHNGSIRLTEVGGNVDFGSHNGSVVLSRVAGSVRGSTHNGAVETELAGNSFTGRSLEVGTHNGTIQLSVPRQYSARIKADTNNGGIRADLPEAGGRRTSRNSHSQEFELGAGGSIMRLNTHNGSIRLRQL